MEGGPPAFPADFTCPQVLRIPLVPSSFRLHDSHILRLRFPTHSTTTSFLNAVLTPKVVILSVWPAPLSLATTRGISVDYFSSAYLDVSLRRVPFLKLWIYFRIHGSSPCGLPHSEICGYIAYLQLPAAYRSLSRPSSAPDAKAFTLCSFSLELPLVLSCLSFANNCFGCFLLFYHLSVAKL